MRERFTLHCEGCGETWERYGPQGDLPRPAACVDAATGSMLRLATREETEEWVGREIRASNARTSDFYRDWNNRKAGN